MASHFTELNLRAELIDGIQRASFQSMTPIQAAALPTMLTEVMYLGKRRQALERLLPLR